MSTGPRPFHEHEDLGLSVAYVLGYSFHSLSHLDPGSAIRGRHGTVARLDELRARLQSLHLTEAIRSAEPLWQLRETLAGSPLGSRIGAASAAEIAEALVILHAAVQLDLNARSEITIGRQAPTDGTRLQVLGEGASARCPEALRHDLGEADRALAANLVTAAVFHLYRVWNGLHAEPPEVTRPDGSPVADPSDHAGIRSVGADASALIQAIRQHLQS